MNQEGNPDAHHTPDDLDLSLSVGIRHPPPALEEQNAFSYPQVVSYQPLPPAPPGLQQEVAPLRPRRRNPSQAIRAGKSETVPAPFPWATTRRATVYSLQELHTKQIVTISGQVQCKKCERQYEMGYDLREKFLQVGNFIAKHKSSMHDRAPSVWMNPLLPSCTSCHQVNCVKPIIAHKKKSINWLFLFLGQTLGCLTLDQLKYFCKHTGNHRTGAKDRVLFLTYLCLCKQLDPTGPFER